MSAGFTQTIAALSHAIHRYFIWIVLASYFFAAVLPGPGLSIRRIDLGGVDIGGTKIALALPSLMLAFLLFNAGLGVRTAELSALVRKPGLLLSGALANTLAPLAFIVCLSLAMRPWHNSEETQQILAGLALVAAMPIAGASSAWAQNANGNLALSVGLILLTTLCSPMLTPLILHAAALVTVGDYSEDLNELASGGSGSFVGAWIVLPSLLGMAAHRLLGEKRAALISPCLKLANFAVIVLLNYSNASLSLPSVIAQPDPDYVVVVLIAAGLLCVSMFGAGYLLSRVFGAGRARTASLMFGLGMNNNGAGLVLASLELSDHPAVMLPIVFYNLIQHFAAALADKLLAATRLAD